MGHRAMMLIFESYVTFISPDLFKVGGKHHFSSYHYCFMVFFAKLMFILCVIVDTSIYIKFCDLFKNLNSNIYDFFL